MNTKRNAQLMQLLVILTGLGLSVFASWVTYIEEQKALLIEFQFDVDERAALLYREVTLNFEALNALAILFGGEKPPSSQRFNSEAAKIMQRHNDIQALEWIPKVKHSQRASFEANQQKLFPDFKITERKQQGEMVTAQSRAQYFPVYFVEPLLGNRAALGFDLASNPTRLRALEQARDTSKAQATAGITLVQGSEKQQGFLAFIPIYQGSTDTLEQRKNNLQGFILGVYRIKDIFISSMLAGPRKGISLTLIDETLSQQPQTLYQHISRTGYSASNNLTYRKQLPSILGRQWTIVAAPTAQYIALRQDQSSILIFGAGVIFTFFLSLYLNSLTRRSLIIEQTVQQQTKELYLANKKLKKLTRIDELTDVANRRFMNEFLDREWLRAIRQKTSLSMLFIDVDFFKLYNDDYGHQAGDRCLTSIAAQLKKVVNRPGDLVARYGGEEFVIILSDTQELDKIARRCLTQVEQLKIEHRLSSASEYVTISIGAATINPSTSYPPRRIISSADKALYLAKDNGRNRVEYFSVEDCDPANLVT